MTFVSCSDYSSKLQITPDLSIKICDDLGVLHSIESPWSSFDNPLALDRVLPGNCIYFGASVSRQPGIILLHFLPLDSSRASKYLTWNVSLDSGLYLSQYSSDFDIACPSFIDSLDLHRTDGLIFASIASKFFNDLVIYQFVKYVLRQPEAASHHINQYAPVALSSALGEQSIENQNTSAHILVLYNHNYSRNIPALDNVYVDRFASVHHVLPSVCPAHYRCLCFPAGSYQYHILLFHALRHIHGLCLNSEDWIVIAQDDVMLHPSFNQHSFLGSLIDETSIVGFYHSLPINHIPSDSWSWNTRIANSCFDQSSQ